MSPELFDPESFGLKDSRLTKHSDRYALGMLIYEVLSGQVPFSRHHGYAVVVRILKGDRPERPQGIVGTWFTNDVWSILGRCWKSVPDDRPRIEDALQCLENASRSWILPSSQTVAGSPATGPLTSTFDSRLRKARTRAKSLPPLKRSCLIHCGSTRKVTRMKIIYNLLLTRFQLSLTMLRIIRTLGQAREITKERTRGNLQEP